MVVLARGGVVGVPVARAPDPSGLDLAYQIFIDEKPAYYDLVQDPAEASPLPVPAALDADKARLLEEAVRPTDGRINTGMQAIRAGATTLACDVSTAPSAAAVDVIPRRVKRSRNWSSARSTVARGTW